MNDNEMELVFGDDCGLQFIPATTPSDADLDGFGGDEFAEELAAVAKRRQDAEGELCFE